MSWGEKALVGATIWTAAATATAPIIGRWLARNRRRSERLERLRREVDRVKAGER